MAKHPRHTAFSSAWEGDHLIWVPARPREASDPLLRFRVRRQCRRMGGHYYDKTPLGHYCCNCGKVKPGG